MKMYTKKWDDYVNKEWKEFLDVTMFNVIYPDEIYDGSFSDDLLKEKFDIYYNAKVRYVSMYDFFEKEFGYYEEIELLSKEEEYQNYLVRFNSLVSKNISIFNERVSNYKKSGIELVDFDINDIDFKLLVLGKVNLKTMDTYKKSLAEYHKILEEEKKGRRYGIIIFMTDINKFLSNYDEYFEGVDDNSNLKLLRDCYFHDTTIVSCVKEGNNIVLDIDLEWNSNRSIRLTFKNASINMDISSIKKGIDIYFADARYYSDVGFYFSLDLRFNEEVVITSDDLEVLEYYTDELLEIYSYNTLLYQDNLDTVKDRLNFQILRIFHAKNESGYLSNKYFNFSKIKDYAYVNDILTINYSCYIDDKNSICSLIFNDISDIKIIMDNKEISKRDLNLYFENKAGDLYRSSSGEIQCTGKDVLTEILKENKKMRIKENNGLLEIGIWLLKNIEIIIICNNIEFEGDELYFN